MRILRFVAVLAVPALLVGCNPPAGTGAGQPSQAAPGATQVPQAAPGATQATSATAGTPRGGPVEPSPGSVSPATPAPPAVKTLAGASVPPPATAVSPVSPAPAVRDVTVPAGTGLVVELVEALASNTSHVNDPVHGRLTKDIVVEGIVVAPEGSDVEGHVTAARAAGKMKGTAELALVFDTIVVAGSKERYAAETSGVVRQGKSDTKKDAMRIGIGAGAGAIIGGIIGGKKGAVIGTAAGGGAGTALAMTTRGEEIRLPKGRVFELALKDPVAIKVTLPPGK